MVQILPQKTNVGSDIGRALGGGLSQGLGQVLQQNFQAGKLGEVFEQLKNSANPMDVAAALAKASIYSPTADRSLAALGPLLINAQRTKNLYGGEGGGLGTAAPGGEVAGQPMGAEGVPGEPTAARPTPKMAEAQALKFVEGNQPAGYLSAPMTPDAMERYAERYAQILQDPNAYDSGLQQAANINKLREGSRGNLKAAAESRGIKADEMPRFLQYATQFQHLNDLPSIERAAIDATLKLRNQKDSLKNLTIPGIGTKLLGGEGLKGYAKSFIPGKGLVNVLTEGGKTRDAYLKKYDSLVNNLVQQGEEPYVRETLASVGLSPTEIEERIHPLTEGTQKNIASLPSGDKMNPNARQQALVSFFKKNVDNNTSLSVLRNALWKDKKYDWNEISSAIDAAFPDTSVLTQYQLSELPTIHSAPKQSLVDIFGPEGNVWGLHPRTEMNPIHEALEAGYDGEDILNFLTKNYPNLAPKINKAKALGNSVGSIINFLSQFPNQPTRTQGLSQQGIHAQKRKEDIEKTKNILKSAGSIAATAGASALAGRALSNVAPKVANLLKGKPPIPTAQQTTAAPTAQALGNITGQAIEGPAAQAAQQSLGYDEIINRLGIGDKIKSLMRLKRNAPETIGALLEPLLSTEKKELFKKISPEPFSEVVKKYAESQKIEAPKPDLTPEQEETSLSIPSLVRQTEKLSPEAKPQEDKLGFKEAFGSLQGGSVTNQLYEGIFKALKEGKKTYAGIRDPLLVKAEPLFAKGLINSPQDLRDLYEGKLSEKAPTPGDFPKGSMAATADGDIGDIQAISGTSVLIDVGGKIKRMPIDELQPEPEAVKKAKIVIDPASIPESARSSALTIVTAPSSRRHVSVVFGPTKKVYTYRRKDGKPIDEKIIYDLKVGTRIPMTTGETYMGAFDSTESDSRGKAATDELTKLSQREEDPDDPSKPLIFEVDEDPFFHGYIDEFRKALSILSKKFKGPPKRKKKND